MKRLISVLAAFVGIMSMLLPGWELASAQPQAVTPQADEPTGPTFVIPIDGMVSKAQLVFLRRGLKEAETTGAGAILLDMDTGGGDLEAAIDMVDALQSTGLPTVTYVNRNAGSAGALIAMATDRIYMTPVGAIGAAAPVSGGGQDLGETLTDKVVSYYSKYFRSAAEQSGHNPDVAEGFINKEIEVKIGDRVISEEGSLLSLSPQEATEIIDGKPVLALGLADTRDDLLELAGLSATTVELEPTGMEQTAFIITVLAPLLLMGAILGAYIEFQSPGFGLPGIFAAICLVLFFAGHSIAGLSGQEALVLFVIGLALVLIELIFFPGLLFMSLSGAAMMVAGLLWAMVDRYPSESLVPDFDALFTPIVNMTIALVGGGLFVIAAAQFLPQTRFFKRIALNQELDTGTSLPTPQASSEYAPQLAVGTRGKAITQLHPTGKAQFGESYVDVISEGGYIAKGEALEVAASRADALVVRKVSRSD